MSPATWVLCPPQLASQPRSPAQSWPLGDDEQASRRGQQHRPGGEGPATASGPSGTSPHSPLELCDPGSHGALELRPPGQDGTVMLPAGGVRLHGRPTSAQIPAGSVGSRQPWVQSCRRLRAGGRSLRSRDRAHPKHGRTRGGPRAGPLTGRGRAVGAGASSVGSVAVTSTGERKTFSFRLQQTLF